MNAKRTSIDYALQENCIDMNHREVNFHFYVIFLWLRKCNDSAILHQYIALYTNDKAAVCSFMYSQGEYISVITHTLSCMLQGKTYLPHLVVGDWETAAPQPEQRVRYMMEGKCLSSQLPMCSLTRVGSALDFVAYLYYFGQVEIVICSYFYFT